MRVLHRFMKAGGHWAEIRERSVTQFRAIEFQGHRTARTHAITTSGRRCD
jgi:hypothetical protein